MIGKQSRLAPGIIVLLCGAINILFWSRWDSDTKLLFETYYPTLKTWLWLALYGRLLMGLLPCAVGAVALVFPRPMILLAGAASLVFVGAWDILNDFLAIPGLGAYGHVIDSGIVWHDLNSYWILVGASQIVAGGLILIVSGRRWRTLRREARGDATENEKGEDYAIGGN